MSALSLKVLVPVEVHVLISPTALVALIAFLVKFELR
jgi:hypothetical protein